MTRSIIHFNPAADVPAKRLAQGLRSLGMVP